MKCRFCGGNISLEDVYCPYCGKKNEEGSKHASDMEHFEREFEQTRQEVYTTTRSYGVLYARIILLVIFVAGIIITAVVASHSYSFQRSRKEKEAARNAKAYIQEMDEMLEEGEYLKFSEFCRYHYISAYNGDKYEKYALIIPAAGQYQYLYTELAQIVYPGPNGTSDYVVEAVGDSLDQFYKYASEEQIEDTYYKDVDEEQTSRAFEGMEAQIGQLLKTYLGLSDEEVGELRSMTKSRRTLLIEESCEELRS